MAEKQVAEEQKETLTESVAGTAQVFVLGMFAFAFLFQNFVIPSGSMLKTLLIGDHVVVDRTTLAPATKWMPLVHYRPVQRGDVIVFVKPTPEDLILVKRAIGLPGDRIHLEHGVLYRNGERVDEPYAAMPDADSPYRPFRDDFPRGDPAGEQLTATWALDLPNHVDHGELVVPPGMIFAMGDNRPYSLDGRFWGFVPEANVVGRPMVNYWSFETPEQPQEGRGLGQTVSWATHVVLHFFDGTRWRRTLHVIR